MALTRRLLDHARYVGLSALETKRHAVTGEHVLIEVNVRVPASFGLGEACGVDAAWRTYATLAGLPLGPQRRQRNGRKVVLPHIDALAARALIEREELSLWDWAKSYRAREAPRCSTRATRRRGSPSPGGSWPRGRPSAVPAPSPPWVGGPPTRAARSRLGAGARPRPRNGTRPASPPCAPSTPRAAGTARPERRSGGGTGPRSTGTTRPGGGSGTAPGCSTWASSSTPSTIRGPGREK